MDNQKNHFNDDVRKPSLRVFIAAISALMGAMCMGCVLGWSAPAFGSMEKSDTLPKLDEDIKSWMGSCITLGALVGGLVCGATIQLLGRKKALIALGCPFTVGWVIICAAKSFWLIIVGRVLTGFASGIACGAAPTYVVEISTPSVRGLLGSGFQVFIVIGILYTDIFGLALDWNWLCLAGLVPGVLMSVLMIFMPESPSWLMNKYGRGTQVVEALKKFRSDDSNIESELKELEDRADKSKQDSGFSMELLKRPDIYKPFIIAICLMFFQQFSGINAVMFYLTDIFKQSGSSIKPEYATIIVSAATVIATISGSLVIDRLGRKILLIASGTGHVLSLGVMGYYYLKNKTDSSTSTGTPSISTTTATLSTSIVTTIASTITSTVNATISTTMNPSTTPAPSSSDSGWLPIVCLVVFVISFSIGFGPIPWMIVAEITPSSAIGFISSIVTAFNWTCAFAITKEFDEVQHAITKYGAFWLFAGISAASIAFTVIFVPETKGKSIEEMQEIFLGDDHPSKYNRNYNTNKPVSNI